MGLKHFLVSDGRMVAVIGRRIVCPGPVPSPARARGILERDSSALVAASELLRSLSRPLLYAAAAEDAGVELARTDRADEAVVQLNAAFDT
jgi:hypothetical protein